MMSGRNPPLYCTLTSIAVQEFMIFIKTSKPRQTRARPGNVELADEAELVSWLSGRGQ